jgi:hypothetical protein
LVIRGESTFGLGLDFTSLQVLLEAGHIQAVGKVGDSLNLETPFGAIQLGMGAVEFEVDAETGVSVAMGSVSIAGIDGTKVIEAGQQLNLEGMIVNMGAVELAPVSMVLHAQPKWVQMQGVGEENWRQAPKQTALTAGERVRTRKAKSTKVTVGEKSRFVLGPGTEFEVLNSEEIEGKQVATYNLTVGTAHINYDVDSKAPVEHHLLLGEQKIRIQTGIKMGAISIERTAKGKTYLGVRFGRIVLANGTIIDAGQKVEIDGAKVGLPKALYETHVRADAGQRTRLFYASGVPPVSFGWKRKQPVGDATFEMAMDKKFKKIVYAENLKGNRFVLGGLKAGAYQWRVKEGDEVVQAGSLNISRMQESECPRCNHQNLIEDDTEDAVVYYQKSLPSLTFSWKPVTGAAKYQVRVFKDGDFDRALVELDTTDSRAALKPGQIREGRYYWLVTAKNASGKTIHTGRTNGLAVAYDNAVTGLTIKTPRPSARTKSRTIVTQGIVQMGASLSINGSKGKVDRKGRFTHTVPLSKGRNMIVYRAVFKGVQRYYVRDVTRL